MQRSFRFDPRCAAAGQARRFVSILFGGYQRLFGQVHITFHRRRAPLYRFSPSGKPLTKGNAMKILVLSTWFPYPCSQGSKTRAYYLIKALASRHQVKLISFEDQPVKAEWAARVAEFCEEIKILPRPPFHEPRLKSILGLFSTQPRSAYASYSREMEALVTATAAAWQPDLIFALTITTAPYALKVPGVRRIVDMDNLMSIMMKEVADKTASFPRRLRKYLAFQKYRRYEDHIFSSFDNCLAVSDLDTRRVQQYTRVRPDQVVCVENGVDLDLDAFNPCAKNPHEMVYNGALTYRLNFDAMKYFLADIFPAVQAEFPLSRIKITGSTEGVALEHLRLNQNTLLTGFVDDIRPVVCSAEICVVPLRRGGGTRLKILEAMALGTALVSTTKGAEGLDIEAGSDYLQADSPREFAQAISRLFQDHELQQRLTEQARKTVEAKYGWGVAGNHLLNAVDRLFSKPG